MNEVVALDVSAVLDDWERLVLNMPLWPVASQNLRTHALAPVAGPMPLDEAITCGWIAVNSERRVLALCIDIDHADGPELVARLPARCPKPMLVICPWSGRAHAILPLVTPVHTGSGARPGPIGLARYALRLFAAALGGTPLPFTNLVKCPTALLHNLTGQRILRGPTPARSLVWEAYTESGTDLMWITQPGDGPAELWDVVNALADEYAGQATSAHARFHWRKQRGEPSAYGRNCMVFDLTRWWAYDYGEIEFERIRAEAASVNAQLRVPLPASEITTIARSIAKFMRGRYKPRYGGGRRGRDRDMNRRFDVQGRQALAGRRSAVQRKAANDERLTAAVAALKAAGEKITQRTIAKRAGVSERTVRSRWSILRPSVQQPPGNADTMERLPTVQRGVLQGLRGDIIPSSSSQVDRECLLPEASGASGCQPAVVRSRAGEGSAAAHRQDAGLSGLPDVSQLPPVQTRVIADRASPGRVGASDDRGRPAAADVALQPWASPMQLPRVTQDGGREERSLAARAALRAGPQLPGFGRP